MLMGGTLKKSERVGGEGGGVPMDRGKAMGYLQKACTMEDSASCYMLGQQLLRQREGRDPKKAEGYLSAACAHGHGPACFNLAVMYNKGDTGVPKDLGKFAEFKGKTEELVKQAGSLQGVQVG